MINRNKKTLLCCLKIKSAGLVIGLVDLFLHLMILLALCTAITKPSIYDYYLRQLSNEYLNDPSLTQQRQQQQQQQQPIKLYDIDLKSESNSFLPISSTNDYFLFNHIYSFNKQDKTIAFLVTLSSALITSMFVYGIFKNKGNYLLPYFCLKVFHVVITVLTTLSFYSCLPNIKLWIRMHNYFPYKDELLNMDKQNLELLMFAVLLAITLFKIYIVVVIWNCYRYIITRKLVNRNSLLPTISTTPSTVNGGDMIGFYKVDDFISSQSTSSLLPPKYDEVVKKKAALEPTTTTPALDSNIITTTTTNNATTSSSAIMSQPMNTVVPTENK